MPSHVAEKEHILACLSSSPSNAKIIKTAAQMAKSFGGSFTALYVKTPADDKANRESNERLEDHIKLAQELGAEIVTAYGEDIPLQITEFARVSKVTKIVLGRSNAKEISIHRKKTLIDRLIRISPDLDIYIIPDYDGKRNYHLGNTLSATALPTVKNLLITFGVLVLSTLLAWLFHILEFSGTNTIPAYMLGVLITAFITKNYICSALFSFASVLLFDWLFIEPMFSLIPLDLEHTTTFVIMLIVSLIMGTIANKLAVNARLSANAAYRTNIVLETTQLLSQTDSEDAVINTMAEQIVKLLNRNVVIYPANQNKLLDGKVFHAANDSDGQLLLTPQEQTVAKWVFINHRRAGAGTGRLKDALGIYYSVRTNDEVFCVVGVQIGLKKLEPFESSVLISILGECALAIEKIQIANKKEEMSLIAKNEQLRANLLRSISHDLRTPLTSISGNTENLIHNFEQIDEDTRIRLLTDVYDDSQWLINLVENLLSITRISEGKMNVSLSPQLVDEVVLEALKHINRKGESHNIITDFGNDLLLADMDARLISQVIINLVDNAIKYTPDGSDIKISAEKTEDTVYISVADNGEGIPDSKKAEVFKMFYTGENKVADCRRSLGLGLSLCESIVNAHGGQITLTDNKPHGSVFTFTLKASEVNLNEQTDNFSS